MKFTVDIPDALFHKAEAVAATRGLSFQELVVQLFQRELATANVLLKNDNDD